MMLLSCTVQERYHRRGYTIDWHRVSLNKGISKTVASPSNDQELASNNTVLQLATEQNYNDSTPEIADFQAVKATEPTDSIEKVLKRKRFNRNLLWASIGAIGIGGLMNYLNFTNNQVDPNYSSTNDYRNYRVASQISYTAGGIGLFSWLIKRGVEDTRNNQEVIIENNENNIVYDTTNVQENVVIQQNENTNNQSSENLKLASSQANASVLLAVLGVLTTLLFGLGLILCIVAIYQANRSIKLAPNAPSARTALIGKRVARNWLIVLGTLLGIVLALILIAFMSF